MSDTRDIGTLDNNCVACGDYHGSIQARLNCLETALATIRADLERTTKERDDLRATVARGSAKQ